MDEAIAKETNQNYSMVIDKLATPFNEFKRTSESAAEEFRNLLEQASIQTTEKRNEAIKAVQESALLTNQYAARKLETIGLDLKTQLSTQSSTLIEKTHSDLAAKNLTLTEVVTSANNQSSEEMAALKQASGDTLSKFSDQVDKSLRKWSGKQKDKISSLNENIQSTVEGVVGITEDAAETVAAIHLASEKLLNVPTTRTWYLSGNEEVCAHVNDMAQRAEESVVISVPDLSCLDVKKLAKVKKPKRRVLIVPETDEPDVTLDSMDGWRIWQTKTPMLLSVIDEREILVGGGGDSDTPMAVISEDDSYLRLYHDVLGPRLIRNKAS